MCFWVTLQYLWAQHDGNTIHFNCIIKNNLEVLKGDPGVIFIHVDKVYGNYPELPSKEWNN